MILKKCSICGASLDPGEICDCQSQERKKPMHKQTLDNMAKGGLLERFNVEFDKICQNIYDLNTKANIKRSINITITFKPSEDRDFVETNISTNSKLAPYNPIETRYLIGKDHKTNKIIAEEYGRDQMKGQVTFDTYAEENEESTKPDGASIIDYRKA